MVAETCEQARAARGAVVVDYEVLPAVVGVLDAIKRGAPLLFDDVPNNLCCDWALGDKAATDAAFRKAAHVARISLVNNRLVGNPMEPRAAIAEYNAATGQYTLWTDQPIPARRALPDGCLRAEHSRSTSCGWWRLTWAAASASSNSTMPKKR